MAFINSIQKQNPIALILILVAIGGLIYLSFIRVQGLTITETACFDDHLNIRYDLNNDDQKFGNNVFYWPFFG